MSKKNLALLAPKLSKEEIIWIAEIVIGTGKLGSFPKAQLSDIFLLDAEVVLAKIEEHIERLGRNSDRWIKRFFVLEGKLIDYCYKRALP